MNRRGWLTTQDVAAHMQVSPRTVQRWCRERVVPHTRVNGRTIRFTVEQLAEIERAYAYEREAPVVVSAPNPGYAPRLVVVPMRKVGTA